MGYTLVRRVVLTCSGRIERRLACLAFRKFDANILQKTWPELFGFIVITISAADEPAVVETAASCLGLDIRSPPL